jgi:hypothetical protein
VSEVTDLSIAKKKIFEALLLIEPRVRVYLDSTAPGVGVPESCRTPTGILVLEYGLNLPSPIKGLVIDDAGILATLSFAKVQYSTWIPWESIFVLCNGMEQGFVFQASIPARIPVAKSSPVGLTSVPEEKSDALEGTSETLARGWLPKIIPGGMN